MNFDYDRFNARAWNLWAAYDDEVNIGTPDELAAVRALRDHCNTYPGIDDDKPADNLWKLRADYIDARAQHIAASFLGATPDAVAARALVAALDASTNGVTT